MKLSEIFKIDYCFTNFQFQHQKITRGVFFYNAGRLLYKQKYTDSRKTKEIFWEQQQKCNAIIQIQNRFCASNSGRTLMQCDARRRLSTGKSRLLNVLGQTTTRSAPWSQHWHKPGLITFLRNYSATRAVGLALASPGLTTFLNKPTRRRQLL